MTLDAVLSRLLMDRVPPAAETVRAWWEATAQDRAAWDTSVDRALVAGACADRLGFAFAAGYAEALGALVGAGAATLAALCATEEGGNRPRAIRTTLAARGDGGYELSGTKSWVTLGPEAAVLYVVATTGQGADGRNQLRMVRVAADRPGVRMRSTSAPFIPEIAHAAVDLDQVVVAAADVLPGDGYVEYLKPFRTIEDVHVHAALVGYLVGVARRASLPRSAVESLLAVACATRGIAAADLRASSIHVALAGVLAALTRAVAEVEAAWAPRGGPEWDRWTRDRSLLGVAGTARAARLDKAWTTLGELTGR